MDTKDNKEKKHAGGRPSKFEDLQEVMRELYLIGKTDKQVAYLLKIDESTITKWKQSKPEFFTSLKGWKLKADENVEKSLYARALGYKHDDVHISSYQGDVIVTNIIKHYPPDTTACIFWLKNRQPKKWRDLQSLIDDGEREGIIFEGWQDD